MFSAHSESLPDIKPPKTKENRHTGLWLASLRALGRLDRIVEPGKYCVSSTRNDVFFWAGGFEPRPEIASARFVGARRLLLQILITSPMQNTHF